MSSEALNVDRSNPLDKGNKLPEAPEKRKTRLRALILAENKKRQPENEFSGSQINLALDLNLSTIKALAAQLRNKSHLTPKDEKDLRLFNFIISENSKALSESSSLLTVFETDKEETVAVSEPEEEYIGREDLSAVFLDEGDKERDFSQGLSVVPKNEIVKKKESEFEILEKPSDQYSHSAEKDLVFPVFDAAREAADREQKKNEKLPMVLVSETRPLTEDEVIQREEEKRFKPKGFVIEAEPETEKESGLVPVEKSETGLENQSLFSVGGEVFWQGHKRVIESVVAGEKYSVSRKGFLGFGKKETKEVPKKELESEQLKRAESAPAEVAKLFWPGQKLEFKQDDGRVVVYKIKSRVGETAFLGTLFFKDDGSEIQLVRKNIVDICRLLSK